MNPINSITRPTRTVSLSPARHVLLFTTVKRLLQVGASAAALAGCSTTPPIEVPAAIKAPVGQSLSTAVSAKGVQIYECRKEKGQDAWVFVAPEVALQPAVPRSARTDWHRTARGVLAGGRRQPAVGRETGLMRRRHSVGASKRHGRGSTRHLQCDEERPAGEHGRRPGAGRGLHAGDAWPAPARAVHGHLPVLRRAASISSRLLKALEQSA